MTKILRIVFALMLLANTAGLIVAAANFSSAYALLSEQTVVYLLIPLQLVVVVGLFIPRYAVKAALGMFILVLLYVIRSVFIIYYSGDEGIDPFKMMNVAMMGVFVVGAFWLWRALKRETENPE